MSVQTTVLSSQTKWISHILAIISCYKSALQPATSTAKGKAISCCPIGMAGVTWLQCRGRCAVYALFFGLKNLVVQSLLRHKFNTVKSDFLAQIHNRRKFNSSSDCLFFTLTTSERTEVFLLEMQKVHCKKRLALFLSQAGMSPTKPPGPEII